MQQLQDFVEGEVAHGLLGLERIIKQANERGLFDEIPSVRGDNHWKYNMVRTIIVKINPKYIKRGQGSQYRGHYLIQVVKDLSNTSSLINVYSASPFSLGNKRKTVPRVLAPIAEDITADVTDLNRGSIESTCFVGVSIPDPDHSIYYLC
jgi:hypothetical protein